MSAGNEWTREDCIAYLGWERAEHIITDDIRLLHRCVMERMDSLAPKRANSTASAGEQELGCVDQDIF
jgi:hypothetical protein